MMIAPPPLSPGHRIAVTGDDLREMVTEMSFATTIAFDFETSGLRYWAGQKPIGFAVGAWSGGAPRCWYVPVCHMSPQRQADPTHLSLIHI